METKKDSNLLTTQVNIYSIYSLIVGIIMCGMSPYSIVQGVPKS